MPYYTDAKEFTQLVIETQALMRLLEVEGDDIAMDRIMSFGTTLVLRERGACVKACEHQRRAVSAPHAKSGYVSSACDGLPAGTAVSGCEDAIKARGAL